jgi:uncharacterized membrane protein YhhN
VKTLDIVKAALVLVAIAIWAYGYRTGSNHLVVAGLVLVLIAFLLRWVPKLTGRR